ncbi:hypothetical protein [Vibrio sp. WXL103]|uniref:hypothetical protein n=1 Tax=Vibrio sp. WXL103 TaxID=3450710 RepID=UPI003EC78291
MSISYSEFKGIPSIVLENDFIRTEWLPIYGAKLASLKLKSLFDCELLYQAPQSQLELPAYGTRFGDYDTSGFDECFPSIDACEVEVERGGEKTRVSVPCHGEVWSLPWDYCINENKELEFSVTSPSLGYRLTKKVALIERELRLSYRVELIEDIEKLPFLWTPHALFRYDEHTQIIVPQRLNEVKSVCSVGRLDREDVIYSYPITHDSKVGLWDCSKFLKQDEGTCDKFYFKQKLKADDVFGFKNKNYQVLMAVDSHTAPHLGIWKNQGVDNNTHNFALEPCSGVYDSAEDAQNNGSVSYVTKSEPRNWYISYYLNDCREI